MSSVVIVDRALREKVFAALSEVSRAHPRSIARLIKVGFFAAVADAVAEDIDLSIADFDAALVISTARVRSKMLDAFQRTQMEPKVITW